MKVSWQQAAEAVGAYVGPYFLQWNQAILDTIVILGISNLLKKDIIKGNSKNLLSLGKAVKLS